MDLKDKIKQLSERLDADKPTPVAQEKQKPVERDYFVTLSFDKRNKTMQKMLPDMEAMGFKLRHESENTLRYHTDAMKEAEANELTTFMEKVKNASSEVFYNLAFDNTPSRKITYADLVESGFSHVYSSKYLNGEQQKNIDDHISTEQYLKNLDAFEAKLISPTFKAEFCDTLIATVKDSIDLGSMTSKFMTEDPVRSMVYESFDFTLKLGHNAMVELHSQHYPYLYSLDTAIGRNFEDAREIKYALRDVKVNDYHDAVGKILNERFMNCETMTAIKSFKEMKPFPKELDTEQTSNDGYSVHYFLSKDHIDRGYGNVKDEICRIVVKTALEYIQMNKAHELHVKLNAVNANSEQMATIMTESFQNRANVKEWKTVVGDPIQAPSAPDAYFLTTVKKFKPT